MAGFGQLWKSKGPFMLQTFALFAAQLLVTYIVMTQLAKSDKFLEAMTKNIILYILITVILPIVLILIMLFVPMPVPAKLLIFTLFSACLGMSLAFLKRFVPPEIIKAALLGTLGIFVAMFVVGLFLTMMGANLWWLGIILFIGLVGLIITSIVFMFIDESKKARRWKAALAIVLFALFVMYDTNQILQRDYFGDVVTAAMDYYLDALNIFTNIISYFTNSE